LAQLRKVRQNGSCASGMAVTARCTVSRSYLETEVTDRQFLMLPRGRASTSIDQCASSTRQDDRRSLESVCGPLIFRTTDAPDRDLCHRYTDRRLWLARDHDRVQRASRRVSCVFVKPTKRSFGCAKMKMMNCALVSVARIWGRWIRPLF
jgi:hypothetical protein